MIVWSFLGGSAEGGREAPAPLKFRVYGAQPAKDTIQSLENLRFSDNARFALEVHVVARQFAEKRICWHAELRAEGAAPGNLTFRQHISGDSERRASIESARANAPAAIGMHNHLVGNL